MLRINRIAPIALILVLISGCRVETHPDHFVLDIYFTPADEDHWHWAASTSMVFDFHNIYYSQSDLAHYQYYYFEYNDPSLDDISWLLWDLGGLDSYVTGTLTFAEIRSEIDAGNPVLLQYGGYYSGHILVLHGYDHRGHVYIHDPGYGTRVVHYDDLYYRYFHGTGHYWESSLLLLD